MNEDIFNHLLEVESQAANMLFDAQVEADEKVSSTKKEIEKEIKVLYNEVVEEQEKRFEKEKSEIDISLKQSIEEYVEKLKSAPLDYESFSLAIDDFFFKNEEG